MRSIFALLVAALAVAPTVVGHAWIEQIRNINDEGDYVGEFGYARGMMVKGDPGYLDSVGITGRVPPTEEGPLIKEGNFACHPNQRKPQQSQDKYPRLKATPGNFIAMRYAENGHVTLPAGPQLGKPSPEEGSGTIFIYGTTEPQEDEKLITVLQWTKDGKGGNGKGTLLATMDFADSRCYEINPTSMSEARKKTTPNWMAGQENQGQSPLLCESNLKIPESVEVGKPYTLYWVWQWPTYPGIDPGLPVGKDEYYTTCIDIDVTSKDIALAAGEAKFKPGQLDSMKKAVPEWKSRKTTQPDVVKGEMGPIFSNLPKPAPGAGNATSSPPAAQQTPAASPAPQSPAATPSPQAPAASPGQPVIPTLSGRPGSAPSPKPTPSKGTAPPQGDDDMVTITDTVFLTVTATPAQSPAASESKRAITSVMAPSANVTPPASRPTTLATVKSSQQPPASAVPSSKLPGFNMGNPNGAKFRRSRFTQ
ncbi:hypothetical protein CC86DRAFT_423600 [Ophiobolus disseminans]|uniref:DUF7492 domain-containing protein n=1 Tax=Ophiobolus disseminans TaxID=1469910 RepID=A0A6A6ZPB7_9PLEO|nr:hypothetical protein CC86DRAFT_423600 [Ophiobolus disseminans]